MTDLFPAFRELRKKVKSVDQFVLINTILKRPEYQKFITDRITKIQLSEQNVDSLGVKLAANRGGYADLTLTLAAEAGRPKKGRDRVDLKDTDKYHESHSVNIVSLKADYFEVMADAQKEDVNLIEEWGPVLGLTDESMDLLANFILEAFVPLFLEIIE